MSCDLFFEANSHSPASREAFAKAINTIAKENAITLLFFH
jgi:hypothetical protein